jgi:hypothetical protein
MHRVFWGPEFVGVGIAPGWEMSCHMLQVRGGHHGHHTGGAAGGCYLHRRDGGMGVGTAQHYGV